MDASLLIRPLYHKHYNFIKMKRAKNASASVPERYIKVASIFPEEFDDVTRPTDIYLLFVSLENMELLGSFKRLVIHMIRVIYFPKILDETQASHKVRILIKLTCKSTKGL